MGVPDSNRKMFITVVTIYHNALAILTATLYLSTMYKKRKLFTLLFFRTDDNISGGW